MSDTWPLGGYAPGNYWCQCHDCNEHFEGDKRAFQCLPCAAKQARGSYASSQAEIERLRTALEFYANPEIYKPHPDGPAFDRRDVSYVARSALEGK